MSRKTKNETTQIQGLSNTTLEMYFHRPETGPIEIVHEPPSSARVFPPVRLGKSTLLTLADSRAAATPLIPPTPFLHYNIHILKSNLQKAIRRGAIPVALATAQQIAYQDPNELVRRLPILMCEDTLLVPPLFVECVWLMVAVSKGYELTTADNTILLQTVGACLAAGGRYNLHAELAGGAIRSAAPNDPVNLAFTLRIAFGGMGGDMAFLGRLQKRWCARELPCGSASAIVTAEPEPFVASKHLLLEAIDFHCFKHMIRDCGGGLSKEVVWWHCSSPNVRTVVGLGAVDQIATEAQRREETAAEYAAHAETIHAFQVKKAAEFVGTVPTHVFKQLSIAPWVTKV